MSHFLPIGKLAIFFLKSAVKPVSKRITTFTKNKPVFIRSCEWLANKNHQMYVRISKWSGNKLPYTEHLIEKAGNHKKMTTEEAVEFFTDTLGELLIIGAGVAFIVWDYRRSKKHRTKSSENDAKHTVRIDQLEQDVTTLVLEIESLKSVIEKRQ